MRRSPLHGALGPPGAPAEGRIRWAWLAALALLFLAGGWGWQVYRARQDEAAAQAERYRAYIERREYRAQSVACRLEFPSGSATRVVAYGDFRWRSWPAELASSAVDSEGEQWAEFYATGSRAQAESLLQGFAADLARDSRHIGGEDVTREAIVPFVLGVILRVRVRCGLLDRGSCGHSYSLPCSGDAGACDAGKPARILSDAGG